MTAQDKNNNPTVRFTRWLVANKWKVAVASVMLGLAPMIAAVKINAPRPPIEFTNDYRVFFSEQNPQLKAFEVIESTYTKTDSVLFMLTPKDGTVFTPKNLEAIEWLTEKAWKIPFSTRVDSITNFQHTRAEGDDLFVDRMVRDPLDMSAGQVAYVKNTVMNEPLLYDRIISKTGHVTGVNVPVMMPEKDPMEVMEVVAYARELKTEFEAKYPDIEARLSGLVVMNHAFAETGQNDMANLTPIMYLVMLVIMAFLLRSFSGTIAALGVIMLGTISAMGLTGLLGIKLTPPSAIAPTIILTLAIADSVHILMTMLHLMRHKGYDKVEAIVESMRINMLAVFLTSLTTVIGFLALNFAEVPPYHDLGNITAMGVATAFFFSVFFLPAAMAILPVHVKAEDQGKTTFFGRFADMVIAHSKTFLLITAVVSFGFIAMVPRLDINDQFVEWFGKSLEFRQSADYLNENMGGIYSIEYSIDSGMADGVTEPQFMQNVEKFAQWWRKQEHVTNVSTYTDIMKRINRTLHSGEQSWYKLPENYDMAAQYLLLYEMSLPFGLDLNNQIDIDKRRTKLSVTFKNISSNETRALAARGDEWARNNLPPVMHNTASGPSVMFSHIARRNVDSMILGTIVGLILITIIMIVSLKSWKYGLLSLIPNVMPALVSFGIWAILYGRVGMAVSVVASATLGIIVDDSVHFLTKYLRAVREDGMSAQDAIRYSFKSVGPALVITSVILVIGFLIMGSSAFELNWSLGALSAITIAVALVADMFALPAILIMAAEFKVEDITDIEIDSIGGPNENLA